MTKIYTLTHPSSTRLYIGKTCRTLNKRLWFHMYESDLHPHLRKSTWIKSLALKGFIPQIKLIEEVDDNLANDKEKYYIKLGWQVAPLDMLNSPFMPGGEGFQKGKNISKESRDKSSRNRRKISNKDLKKIVFRINNGEYIKDIAIEYKVHPVTIIHNLKGSVINTSALTYKHNGPRGIRHGMSKIDTDIVNEIRQKYSSGNYDQYKLAKEYGLTQASIWSIIKNKTWKDISYKIPAPPARGKLNKSQKEEVIERLKNNEPVKNILKEYQISQTQLYRMKNIKNKVTKEKNRGPLRCRTKSE